MMRRSSALCLWSLVKNKHEDILERIEDSPCKSTCQILSAVNGSETMYSKGDTLGQITGMNIFNVLLDRSIFERFPASTFTFTPNSCGLPCQQSTPNSSHQWDWLFPSTDFAHPVCGFTLLFNIQGGRYSMHSFIHVQSWWTEDES